jgi:hypothetical protein
MRDRLWEELLAKVKADEGKQELSLMDEIKLKSSFKIKMDMIEKKDEIDLQKNLKRRILRMKPEFSKLDQRTLEELKLALNQMIKW